MSRPQSLNKENLAAKLNLNKRDHPALSLVDLKRTQLKSNLLLAKSIVRSSLNALTQPNLTMPMACAKIAIMLEVAQSWLPNVIIRTVPSMHKASARTVT